ncbi:hypothetical protein SVIOM74S_05722 [Streptomyces violarus]
MVGAVLDVSAQGRAFRAEGVAVQETSLAQVLLGGGPLLLGPCSAGFEEVDGYVTGGGVQDQGFQAADALAQQTGHVAVSAELPEQCLGVPQLQHRLQRPRQCGMRGEQRAALRVFAGRLGRPAGQRQDLAQVGQFVDLRPPQSLARLGVPRVQHLLRRRRLPDPVDRLPYDIGVEVVEGGDDQLGGGSAEGGAAEGEVAGASSQAELRVPSPCLGGEVDHGVYGLEAAPGRTRSLHGGHLF